MKHIIITGAKRSGATFFLNLLDSAPETFSFLRDGWFFEYLYDMDSENIKGFIDLQKQSGIEMLTEGMKKRGMLPFFEKGYSQGPGTVNKQHISVHFDIKRLKSEFGKRQKDIDGTVCSVWETWLRAYIAARGCDARKIKNVLFKCGDYAKSAVTALKHLKDVKVIIVIRDPRYAIDSLKRSRELRKEKDLHLFELFNTVNDYRLFLKNIRKAQGINSGAVLVIKYEDIVREPARLMREVSYFLEIPFNEIMLRPTVNGKPWYGLSSFKKLNGISRFPKRRNIMALSRAEIEYINKKVSNFLRHFNYIPSKQRVLCYEDFRVSCLG